MSPPHVVVFDERIIDLSVEREVFEDEQVELTLSNETDAAAVRETAADAYGIIVDANVPVPADLLTDLDALEIVARSGIGFDNIDVDTAEQRDVRVTNVPDYCLDEVSTHALSLLLSLVRKVHVYDRSTSEGQWEWSDGVPIDRLSDRTLGIVGFGNIGSRAAAKADPFFDEILVYDPYVPDGDLRAAGVSPVSFETLLEGSDAISLHPPLTDETRAMIDEDAFDRMGEGTYLVNTSRGEVIDQDALLDALEDETIAGAGLDVMETEPPGSDPLLGREDVIATPHAAWYSEQSTIELRESAAEEVKRSIEGREPLNPVAENPWL